MPYQTAGAQTQQMFTGSAINQMGQMLSGYARNGTGGASGTTGTNGAQVFNGSDSYTDMGTNAGGSFTQGAGYNGVQS